MIMMIMIMMIMMKIIVVIYTYILVLIQGLFWRQQQPEEKLQEDSTSEGAFTRKYNNIYQMYWNHDNKLFLNLSDLGHTVDKIPKHDCRLGSFGTL